MNLRCALAAILLSAALSATSALGLIVAVDGAASLTFREQDLPPDIRSGSFSCFLWVQPGQTHDIRRRLISLPEGVRVTVEPGRGVRAVTLDGSGLDAAADMAMVEGAWGLVVVSLDRAASRLDIWAGSAGAGLAHGLDQDPRPGPPADDPWALGAWGGQPGVAGAYGLVVIRSHAIGDGDARAVWDSRRYFAPMDHDNTASGGRMTGWQGAVWMIGHGFVTGPLDGGVADPEQRVGLVGGLVTESNLLIVNSPVEPVDPSWKEFRTVRPIESAQGFRYESRLLGEYGGFFRRDVPAASIPQPPAPALAPKARQLATGPTRPLRIVASANSRGMRSIVSDDWAQNYAHGFVQRHLGQTSGVVLRPLSLVGNGGPWLGFDTKDAKPPSDQVQRVDRGVGADSDFSRFFTGAGTLASRGPGGAVRIFPGGFQAMRCRPVDGSLIRADAPLTCEAHLLSFPGASELVWRSDRAESQGAEGLLGDERRLELDSTRASRTLAAPDRVIDGRRLALGGDWRSAIEVGDAAFISAGHGAGAISVVERLTFGGVETVITFEHPFGDMPQIGSEVLFGPWSIRTVHHDFGPIAPGDTRTWRGIRMGAADDGRGGVIALGVSAYREDTPGFIFGAVGWGGNGYDKQLDASFAAAPQAWMALSRADVWLEGFAQQGSGPGSMLRFAQQIRAALPEADIVWMGDTEHGSTYEPWHDYILTHGPGQGIPAISVLLDERAGTFLEQLADGMRADAAHYSAFGNLVLADLWTEQLAIAAIGDCPADCDASGALDFFDFLCFQVLFATGDPEADCDSSGGLDFFDFLCFQAAFATGCP